MQRKNTLFIIMFTALLFSGIMNAQVLFSDNFDYTVGTLSVQGGWVPTVAAATPLQVIGTSLTYPGYANSGVGGSVQYGTSGQDDNHPLGASLGTGSVYASFLVNCSAAQVGDYFIHFADGGSFNFFARTAIRASATNTFDFGIEKYSTGGAYVYTNQPLNFNETYLIVIKYTFNPATTTDDEVDLFLNPDISGTEPAPTILTSAGTDITGITTPSTISTINLRQGSSANAATLQLDGIIVGTQWSDLFAPLPVELTSFTAAVVNNTVNLRWSTATESNNKGFDIQRKSGTDNFTTIASIKGNGTSTITHNYIYSDKLSASGNYTYRLKQIDYSGEVNYSKAVEASVTSPVQFGLNQNFPNPFNPSTTINFNIAKAGNVSLKVYNLLGQEVRTLLTGFKEAGSYSINFNAEGLNSGLYLYKLESEGLTQVRKMTLLK